MKQKAERTALCRPVTEQPTRSDLSIKGEPAADISAAPETVSTPTLVIWGEQDRYLSPTLLDRLGQWVTGLRIERIPDASHWMQNDVPDRVNRLLIEFFKA
jgi:pimeloyl-ACP methyl ester carboxylesterase